MRCNGRSRRQAGSLPGEQRRTVPLRCTNPQLSWGDNPGAFPFITTIQYTISGEKSKGENAGFDKRLRYMYNGCVHW